MTDTLPEKFEVGQELVLVKHGSSFWHIPEWRIVNVSHVTPSGIAKAKNKFGEYTIKFKDKAMPWRGFKVSYVSSNGAYKEDRWQLATREAYENFKQKQEQENLILDIRKDLRDIVDNITTMSREKMLEQLDKVLTDIKLKVK